MHYVLTHKVEARQYIMANCTMRQGEPRSVFVFQLQLALKFGKIKLQPTLTVSN